MVNELQVGRFNAILTKLLSMKEGAPSPILAPEIIPTVVLENDRPEWAFLFGGRLGAAGLEQVAVALEFPAVQLFNPVGSGILMVVEHFQFESTTGQQFRVGPTATPLATAPGGASGSRDLRGVSSITTGQVVGQIRSATSALAFPTFYLIYDHLQNPFVMGELKFPFILDPGKGMTVQGTAVASTMRMNCAWRERILEVSEER